MSFILLGVLNSQAEAAGGGAFDLLETTLITANTASVTMSNLNNYSNYKHLQIRWVGRTDRNSHQDGLTIRFNSSTTGYRVEESYADGSSWNNNNIGASSQIDLPNSLAGTQTYTDTFGVGIVDILDFADTLKTKSIKGHTGVFSSTQRYTGIVSAVWNDTSAITSLLFNKAGSNFVSGTRISLYGVKA